MRTEPTVSESGVADVRTRTRVIKGVLHFTIKKENLLYYLISTHVTAAT